MKENQNIEISDEIKERIKVAFRVANEIVGELQLPEFREIQIDSIETNTNHFFKNDTENDIRLYAKIWTIWGFINVDFSLVQITFEIIWLHELILSKESSSLILKPSVIFEIKKRNIDILKLFNLGEFNIQQVIENHTKAVINLFIENFPSIVLNTFSNALDYSKIGYYKNIINPLMKQYWEKLGLPKDFELITQEQLEDLRKNNLGVQRWIMGDKRLLLNLDTLADEYDGLKKQYSEAKKHYFNFKESYKNVTRNYSDSKCLETWMKSWSQDFPNLKDRALNLIANHAPFELARKHLAKIYGYEDESIRKKIRLSRKLKFNRG